MRSTALAIIVIGCSCVAFVQAEPPASSAPAADAARRSQVLASFAGQRITVGDLEATIAQKPIFVRRRMLETDARRELLSDMIEYELLLREAERRGYGDHPAVRDAMALESLDLLSVQEAKTVDAASLSPEEVAAHYEAHRAVFSSPAMRRAGYVVSKTREEAEQVRARVAQMPLEEFRRHAASLSPSGGGAELGYVDASGRHAGEAAAPPLRARIAAIAFRLESVGETVAEPVEDEAGWIVVRLTALKPGHGEALSEVEPQVREHLAVERRKAAVEALVARLREQHRPEVSPGLIDPIRLDDAKPLDIPHGFPAAPPDPTAPPEFVEPDGA